MTNPSLEKEELDRLVSAGATVKEDLVSVMSKPPHLFILHQDVEAKILDTLKEGTFLMTNADVAQMLKEQGYLSIATIARTGVVLLRKVWNCIIVVVNLHRIFWRFSYHLCILELKIAIHISATFPGATQHTDNLCQRQGILMGNGSEGEASRQH